MGAAAKKQTAGNGIGKGTPGPGRKKGVPNKNTTIIKEMILEALDKAGGVDYLKARAVDQPSAFLALVGKVLPLQLTGKDDGPIQIANVSEDIEVVDKLLGNLSDRQQHGVTLQ
jgi:hypothetical protein